MPIFGSDDQFILVELIFVFNIIKQNCLLTAVGLICLSFTYESIYEKVHEVTEYIGENTKYLLNIRSPKYTFHFQMLCVPFPAQTITKL